MSSNDNIKHRDFQSHWVYLIQGETTKVTKIGITNWPGTRITDLQRASPDKLVLYATLRCIDRTVARTIENQFHHLYKDKRVHYEWYSVSPEDVIARVPGYTWKKYINEGVQS
jgi:hypothetical protein